MTHQQNGSTPEVRPSPQDSEQHLYCEGHKKLHQTLQLARKHPWITSWLFGDSKSTFHKQPPSTPPSASTTLSVRAWHRAVRPGTSRQFVPAADAHFQAGAVHAGYDLQLVAVAWRDGVLVGYSFGGREPDDVRISGCSYDSHYCAFLPHAVGRFAFDAARRELLQFAYGMTEQLAALMCVRQLAHKTRERCLFVVPNVQYDAQRLPDRLYSVVTSRETRVDEPRGVDMAHVARDGGFVRDDAALEAGLRALAQVLLGEFFSQKIQKDVLDVDDSEVRSRISGQILVTFDRLDDEAERSFGEIVGRVYAAHVGGD